MAWLLHPPTEAVFRRREAIDLDEDRLRRSVESGEYVRIAPGAYLPRAVWHALDPVAQHAQRVWEAAVRVAPGTVVSHAAAAALHGIDQIGEWPSRVDVSVPHSGGGRSTGMLRRRSRVVRVDDVRAWGPHFVTSPAQTDVDLAATTSFIGGVAAMDQVLWAGRPGGALATRDELEHAVVRFEGRGRVRARRCFDFAASGAANVRESHSRVLIHALGFPAPVIQRRFELPSGRIAFADFFWPEFDVLGELDGMRKYFADAAARGVTAHQALSEEKDREDELRRVVTRVVRWRVPTLDHPAHLWDLLRGAGLPSSLPRPGR